MLATECIIKPDISFVLEVNTEKLKTVILKNGDNKSVGSLILHLDDPTFEENNILSFYGLGNTKVWRERVDIFSTKNTSNGNATRLLQYGDRIVSGQLRIFYAKNPERRFSYYVNSIPSENIVWHSDDLRKLIFFA